MATYTLRDVQSMLGMSRATVSSLIAAGFVTPARGLRREYRFSFQDVVLLRTARSLQQAALPARRILRSLRRLRQTLPGELPLAGLRITAVGSDVAVREGGAQWNVESGQLLFDFDVTGGGDTVRILNRSAAPAAAASDRTPASGPDAWFAQAVALEPRDPAAAEAAYRRAAAESLGCADAALNLGVMLCEAGRAADAVAVYRDALTHCPAEPLLHFNLAVALEDLDQPTEALAGYESCLRMAPDFSDAHYNAGRLAELLGQSSRAIRHYNAYRRLQPPDPT